MKELLFFAIFIAIFTIGFGTAVFSLLYLNEDTDTSVDYYFTTIKSIIDFSYWPTFGDTGKLEVFDEGYCDKLKRDNSTDPCPDPNGAIVAYILFIFYIITMNVMLINIIIAVFG